MHQLTNKLNFKISIFAYVTSTISEVVGLTLWLLMVEAQNVFSGVVTLWVTLVLERVLVVNSLFTHTNKNISSGKKPSVWKLGFSALFEVIIWYGWLILSEEGNGIVAVTFLGSLLLVEHSLQYAELNNVKFTYYLINPKTILFSLIETAAGTLWLYMVKDLMTLTGGIAILLIGLLLEHFVQNTEFNMVDKAQTSIG